MLLDLPHVHIFVVMSAWVIISTRCGQKEIVELLIVKGADVNAKDTGGKTPLDWAIGFQRFEIADLLRKHGGKTGEELK